MNPIQLVKISFLIHNSFNVIKKLIVLNLTDGHQYKLSLTCCRKLILYELILLIIKKKIQLFQAQKKLF